MASRRSVDESQRLLSLESAARAKLQRRVTELEELLQLARADAHRQRIQRDALHSQVLALGLPARTRHEAVSPTPESESAAESASTEQPDCSQLHQTIAALRKQVVESAASSSVSSVRIDQLQRELTGARGVIEQLQLQLQQAQMQPIRWPSRSASAAARPPVADPLERLRLRLRQCEAERDQYSAMCTRLQHALDNVVGGAGGEGMGGADGSAVGDADGSALHGQNNVHTEGRTSEEVTRETAAKCSTLLRSEGRGGISPEKHLLPWFLEEMLWVTQLQLRMASEIPLGQQRASLDRFAAPGCAPDGESDGGSGCNCVHESSPQPSSMSEAFRSAHRLLSELRDAECQPSEHGTALPPAYS